MSLENFSITSANYFFLHFNMLNDYALAISAVTQLYILELQKRSSFGMNYEKLFLIMTFILMVIVIVIMIFTQNGIIRYQNVIIKVFLEIPMHEVKALLQSTHQFMNSMETDEDNETQYESSENIQDNEEDSFLKVGIKKSRRKRKFKTNNTVKLQFSILLTFIAFTM